MKRMITCLCAVCFLFAMSAVSIGQNARSTSIKLPEPKYDGAISVEKALKDRRSVRAYKDVPLTQSEVSQILWAAQGLTETSKGLRTAPSARAQYFLTLYFFAGNVTGLNAGMYRYVPSGHTLQLVSGGDMKHTLYKAVGQTPIQKAPAAIVIAGAAERALNENLMYLEAGHASQNIYLQGVTLGIGTVAMAGFDSAKTGQAINLPSSEKVLYIMPIGRK